MELLKFAYLFNILALLVPQAVCLKRKCTNRKQQQESGTDILQNSDILQPDILLNQHKVIKKCRKRISVEQQPLSDSYSGQDSPLANGTKVCKNKKTPFTSGDQDTKVDQEAGGSSVYEGIQASNDTPTSSSSQETPVANGAKVCRKKKKPVDNNGGSISYQGPKVSQESPVVNDPPTSNSSQETPVVNDPPTSNSSQETPVVNDPPTSNSSQESPDVNDTPTSNSSQGASGDQTPTSDDTQHSPNTNYGQPEQDTTSTNTDTSTSDDNQQTPTSTGDQETSGSYGYTPPQNPQNGTNSYGSGTAWFGVNCFFIHTFPQADQEDALKSLQAANIKAVRIFITTIQAGSKGTTSLGAKDLEEDTIGQYDDSQLDLIDQMLPLAKKYGIKLIIAIHDRYALGVWQEDAYAKAYGYPQTGGNADQGNLDKFYQDADGISAFENRMKHVITYKSKTMGKPWSSLPEVIQSFDIQNESQGHLSTRYSNWLCDRATFAKQFLTGGVLISTGGGAGFDDSLDEANFKCPAIDVVSIHSYDSADSFAGSLQKAADLAKNNDKKIVFEEFGTQDGNKASMLKKVAEVANPLGIPSMIWQAMPSKKGDFEFWKDETENWAALTSGAASALQSSSSVAP